MPLPGGPADKAGNSYERRWTVFALLDLLLGRAQSLRIEVPGDEGIGAEFRLLVDGTPEWHQAKRQRAAGAWTISALANDGVLEPWWSNIHSGGRCVFVSSSSAQDLFELTERASGAQSWDEFDATFLAANDVRKAFDRLRRAWSDPPPEAVYDALHHIQVRSIGEPELAQWIEDRLRSLVSGPTATAAAVLAQLADDSVHQELTYQDVRSHLSGHGIALSDLHDDAVVVRRVAETADAHMARLRLSYIGGREVVRAETARALQRLADGVRVLLTGTAGVGKSVVTAQIIAGVRHWGWPVLVVPADRLPDVLGTRQLGVKLGLPESPATVLAAVAAGDQALLVIDQLDAVSVVSGRHPERLGIVADLLNEVASFPAVRVLLACRQFDFDNDRELRAVASNESAESVEVGNLDETQVKQALSDAGVATTLPPAFMQLLAVPLHLAVYVDLAQAGVSDVQSARTLTELYERYWSAKRDACRKARSGLDEWPQVIELLVQRMSERQELSVPAPMLDDLDHQARVMASEGVLVPSQGRVSFFHETFFDYCFARQFVKDGGSLRVLLTASEQDLFRRAQIRQILTYQRVADFSGYLDDFAWLVTATAVRLHVKALVIALLESLTGPSAQEWQVVRALANDTDSPLHNRLGQTLRRNPAWFPVLDRAGDWEMWLQAGGSTADRAMWALTGIDADHAGRVADLLTGTEGWRSRRRGLLPLFRVEVARELFDLVLAAINEGDYDDGHASDFWQIARQLVARQPEWCIEMLAAAVSHAVHRADDEGVSPFEVAGPLQRISRSVAQPVTRSVPGATPAAFVNRLLPLFLHIMQANERPDPGSGELISDGVWHTRIYKDATGIDGELLEAMCVALAALATTDREHAANVFENLKSDPHETAAYLLARGYVGNAESFADDAADWIARTPSALRLGYSFTPSWVARELIAAISPHCSADRLDQLINTVMFYASPFERTHRGLRSRGFTELCLLNGLDPARRPQRVERRLAELRRKFGFDDTPPPEHLSAGVVPPPIPEDKARRMTDRQWLRAMERYGSSERLSFRDGQPIGDASTQAQVLETLTGEDPQRFARLLLEVPAETAKPYVSAILRGLTGAPLDSDLLTAVCQRAREIGGSDPNRWLVRLVQSQAAGTVPTELVVMVAEIAVGDLDPGDRQEGEPWNGGDIDSAALNSTRGAAALAINQLVAEEPARLASVRTALEQLVADPQPEVRAATAAALAPLFHTDPDLAIALFGKDVEGTPDELLASNYVEHFVNVAIRFGRYADVAPVVERMTASADEDARKIGARQLVVASYQDEQLDPTVDTILTGADETSRASAVGVFADNIKYEPRRERSAAVVSNAFDDPAKAVRDAAQRAFYDLDDERLDSYEAMLMSFAGSLALADGNGAAFAAIERSRHPLPSAVLDICEAFVRTHGVAIGDIATAAAGDGIHVVQLALRLHAQHSDPVLRSRCLDVIDQLVAFQAPNIERELDSVDR